MGRHFRTIPIAIAATLLAAAGVSPAADAAPESVFTAKGLVKSGFRLVSPLEKPVIDAAKKVQSAKSKLAVEAGKRRELVSKMQVAQKSLDDLHDLFGTASEQLAKDPKNNAVVGQYNALLEQMRRQAKAVDGLKAQQDKLIDSRSEYVTAVLEAARVADANARAYDGVAKDKELADAIDVYNRTAASKVKLGPSPEFTDDLALITKCRADVTTASVPVSIEDGVPHVDVLVNGKSKQTMIWDSGASLVSVSSKNAAAMGIKVASDAQTMTMTVADGRKVKAKLATIDSIRLGAFTVNHVDCVVMPPEMKDCDSLLGNTFQCHFQFKMDAHASTLQLTQLDAEEAPAGPPVTVIAAKAAPIEFINPKNVTDAGAVFADLKKNHADLLKDQKQIELLATCDPKDFHRNHGDLKPVTGGAVPESVVSHEGGMWLWGVYKKLPAGKYVVVYHTQLQGEADDSELAFFDLCIDGNTAGGGHPDASEFTPNKWACYPAALTLDGSKTVEIRCWSSGHPIAIDRVYLFALR